MEQIVEFLISIGKAIGSAFDFLIDIVDGIAFCVKLLAYFTLNIPDYFSWIPDGAIVAVTLIFGVAVTYKILGREG